MADPHAQSLTDLQDFLPSLQEFKSWPNPRVRFYATLGAVLLIHTFILLLAFNVLIPRAKQIQEIQEIRQAKTNPKNISWIDNSVTPALHDVLKTKSLVADTTKPRLPFATGPTPEKDPASQIALPIKPPAPEVTSQPTPKTEPPPAPKPRASASFTLPKETPPSPKPKPAPKTEPKPAPVPKLTATPSPKTKPKSTPIPKLTAAPAPTPTPKPTPKPEPAPKPTPAPPPKPAPTIAKPEVLPPPAIAKPEVLPPTPPTTPAPAIPGPTTTAKTRSQGPATAKPGQQPTPGSRGSGTDLSGYHQQIHDAFHRNWRQPAALPTREESYETKVKITIARNGTIVGTSVVKTSGNITMDGSVLKAVQSVRQIAPLPNVIEGATYSVIINFQLD